MKKVSKEQFADNAMWKLFEIMVSKVIALIIATVIARILAPEAYGVIAITTVFITFSDIFIMNGFNIAIVRKKTVNNEDYSTVMVLSLSFSIIVYIILFFAAPFLAEFFKSPELKLALRIITLLIFFKSVATVIRAKATREFNIKKISIVTIVCNFCSSVIALVLAYNGYGVWALVAQQVLVNFLDVVLLSIAFHWKFSFRFSMTKAKEMIHFTLNILSASFLDFLGNNASSLVIGRVYTTPDLAYINRGNMYPETISLNTYNAINSVLLPTLASRQNDDEGMKNVVRKVISLTEYIILPMMFGLAAISDKFVSVLLTSKWNSCIPIMICACVGYGINPIRSIGYQVFYAKGESKRSLNLEIVRSLIMIINLLITVVVLRKSIYVLSAMNVVVAIVIAIATQIQVGKCIHYSFCELIQDLCPTLIMSGIMVIIVRLIVLLPFRDLIVLLLQIVVGGAVFISMSIKCRNENFVFIKNYLSKKVREKK